MCKARLLFAGVLLLAHAGCGKPPPSPEEQAALDRAVRESTWKAVRAQYYADLHLFAGKWESTLRDLVQGCDRIVIRRGNLQKGGDPIYFTISDTAEVEEFIRNIQVDESESDGSCECSGREAVEFYQGSRLLARMASCGAWRFKFALWPCDGRLKRENGEVLWQKYYKTIYKDWKK
jgi:hypothetical protein